MTLRFFIAVLIFASTSAGAQQQFNIAIVSDGPDDRLSDRLGVYVSELMTLTENEFDVRIRPDSGNWTHEGIEAALDRAYQNTEIDMVLVIGFVGNQLASMRDEFPKPTFLPVLLDTGKLVSLPVGLKSGIRNLSYLSFYADFNEDLDAMNELVVFDKLVLLMDEQLSAAIATLKEAAYRTSRERGIELVEITHDGVDHDLMARVPEDTGALFVAGLPRMPVAQFDQLILAVNAAGIPSYSFVGIEDVKRGLLMTSSESRDIERQARMNALNMQAVMLGERAEDQPVSSQAKKKLTINMATARLLGLSPAFDVMNSATLLNERPTATGQQFGLIEIAHEAVNQNRDLLAQRYGVEAGFEEIGIARSSLLPQLDLSTTSDYRKVSPAVQAGLSSERTTDGTVSLQQLIYSDSAAANVTIQRELQNAREATLNEVRLDIVQAATSAYYTVLNAQAQLGIQEDNLAITRRNLDLAGDRVRIGSSSMADVFRWQAEEARAQILVLEARASANSSWNSLNRLLHRPQFERLALREASFDEPFVMSQQEFDLLVRSPADYTLFSQFFVNRGLSQAPELMQVDAQLTAKQRELTSQKRSYWLPDFSIGGRYSSNFGQSGAGGGPTAGEDLNDWTVGLQATLPLFSGGQRRARVSRAGLELRQLEALRSSTAEKVEQAIRLQLHLARAAYGRIELSATAAEASRRNYELVADAYAQGTVSIVQLLDAQDANLSANATSVESLYSFLTTIMAMQRAVGGFDYLLPEAERIALANALRDYMKRSGK